MRKFSSFPILLAWFVFFLFVVVSSSFANGVAISNVSLEDRYPAADEAVIEFDIEWDNAYRAGYWYDCVWIFFKAKKNSGTTWYHVMVKDLAGEVIRTQEHESFYSRGDNADISLMASTDETGVLLFPSQNGSQPSIYSNDVRVVLNYGAAPLSAGDTDDIQVRVFAIEMIQIPEGSYSIPGDPTVANSLGYGSFDTDFTVSKTLVRHICSKDVNAYDDSQLEGTGIGIDGDGGLDTDDNGTVDNANYPTGYTTYLLMKYEMTQGQYRDFLNTLTRVQQNTRTQTNLAVGVTNTTNRYVMSNTSTMSNRQGIRCPATFHTSNPITFGCDYDGDGTFDETVDGEWIAMNYLSWPDVCAYADWAGLRPATELEYERACWGAGVTYSDAYLAHGYQNVGIATGGPSNAGTNTERPDTVPSYPVNEYDSGFSGPIRVGFESTIGATSNSRSGTSSGYYGNRGLSGNVWEYYVCLGTTACRAYAGSHGDGILTTTASYEGNATNTDWPGINATSNRGVTSDATGYRGGSWNTDHEYGSAHYLAASDRTYASYAAPRASDTGGRLASDYPLER
ncbi:MAG TPA: SUMF1/EgtB/PvdO family nonheme iron enzyme [Candidatus Bathyarchaeia archaeon]|nr:SUMF1/EgtB/PvdO family nonheme iron enzyme [Candidatus Bathyarchaeia archaeon]